MLCVTNSIGDASFWQVLYSPVRYKQKIDCYGPLSSDAELGDYVSNCSFDMELLFSIAKSIICDKFAVIVMVWPIAPCITIWNIKDYAKVWRILNSSNRIGNRKKIAELNAYLIGSIDLDQNNLMIMNDLNHDDDDVTIDLCDPNFIEEIQDVLERIYESSISSLNSI